MTNSRSAKSNTRTATQASASAGATTRQATIPGAAQDLLQSAAFAGLAGPPDLEHLPPETLKPYRGNARTHSNKQIRLLANAIQRFGFQGAVIINADAMILAGHARVEAAKRLNLLTVPCRRVVHLTSAEERAFVLADNRIALSAGWDRAVLADELQDLAVQLPALEVPLDIAITGFEVGEIDGLLLDHQENGAAPTDEETMSVAPGPAVTRRGDLWELGNHRLLCGDARDPSAYAPLMQGEAAEMVICDPPFNVRIAGHVSGRGKAKHGEFAFASGEMSDGEYHQFLMSSVGQSALACRLGALLYIFIDWRHVMALCKAGEELGLHLVNICVWNKTTPGQGSFYRSAHELICVFQKPGGPTTNNVELGRFGRSRSNVWTFSSPNKFKSRGDPLSQHPTPKPVGLVAEAIKDASARRGIVLDGFVGSGTTILAAEKVGRVGYGIEYEPVYCDLTIARWQEYTGKDAVLAGTGQCFEDVATSRREAGGGDSSCPKAASSTEEGRL